MKHTIYIVTGAPGSGKSTAIEAFLGLESDYVAFDIDWLIDTASILAHKNVHVDETTWHPFRELWFEVLLSLYKNHKTPVLFAPVDRRDLQQHPMPSWCETVDWLLLDCDDTTRRERLQLRSEWTSSQIDEAIAEASFLRQTTDVRIDTSLHSPSEVACEILAWLRRTAK